MAEFMCPKDSDASRITGKILIRIVTKRSTEHTVRISDTNGAAIKVPSRPDGGNVVTSVEATTVPPATEATEKSFRVGAAGPRVAGVGSGDVSIRYEVTQLVIEFLITDLAVVIGLN